MNHSGTNAWSDCNDSPALKSKCSTKGNSSTKGSIGRKREHANNDQISRVSES